MKKIILAFLALSVLVFAADYSSMSVTDLQSLRGTVPTEDRAVFQASMQEKMQALSPAERATLTGAKTSNPGMGSMGANAGGTGAGSGGSGAGTGKGGGNGKGGRN